jgi:hypothetical protein
MWERHKPDIIPTGYKLKEVKCFKCGGTRFFSGRYGQTACEDCTNGKVFRLVKMRIKKKK